jgi:RNA polymerase sigma-70 factor (ECF subfamily)
VFRILKNREGAEEIAQDAFVKSFKELDRLEDPAKYKSWLLKIAYRKSIDQVRLKKVQTIEVDEYAIPEDDHGTIPDPLVLLQKKQRNELVEALIEPLNEVDRGILILYYLEDFKVTEVAEATGLSESNIKIKLMRARAWLKSELTRKAIEKEDLY